MSDAPEQPTAEVVSLAGVRAERTDDNSQLTVEDNLVTTLAGIKAGKFVGQQSIILLLDKEGHDAAYNITVRTQKLRRSESIALLHAAATLLTNRLIGDQ